MSDPALPDPDAGAHTWVTAAGADPEEAAASWRPRPKWQPPKMARLRKRGGGVGRFEATVTLEEWRKQNAQPPPAPAKSGQRRLDPLRPPPGHVWRPTGGVETQQVGPELTLVVFRPGMWTVRRVDYYECAGEDPDDDAPVVEVTRRPWCSDCGARPARSARGGPCDACRKRRERQADAP